MRGTRWDDRGSGSVLGLIALAVIVAGGLVVLAFVATVGLHQRASVAADLAALAAATHPAEGCDYAVRIAQAHDARLDDCVVQGSDVRVQVSVPAPSLLSWLADSTGKSGVRVTARARAGNG